jgi:hypothetical protein
MKNVRKGQKVLVRVMECTNEQYDQWDVVYKTGVVEQECVLRAEKKVLCTVHFPNGTSEYVWTNHILDYPKEWNRQSL